MSEPIKAIRLSVKIVNLMNELYELDSEAIDELVNLRVPCNNELADHPTCQVTHEQEVGLLGILNALGGVREDGMGFVAVEYDEVGQVVGFCETP